MSFGVENLEVFIGIVRNYLVVAAEICGIGVDNEQFENITCNQRMVSLGEQLFSLCGAANILEQLNLKALLECREIRVAWSFPCPEVRTSAGLMLFLTKPQKQLVDGTVSVGRSRTASAPNPT